MHFMERMAAMLLRNLPFKGQFSCLETLHCPSILSISISLQKTIYDTFIMPYNPWHPWYHLNSLKALLHTFGCSACRPRVSTCPRTAAWMTIWMASCICMKRAVCTGHRARSRRDPDHLYPWVGALVVVGVVGMVGVVGVVRW